MTGLVKEALLSALQAETVDRLARRLSGRGAILAYHGVVSDGAATSALHVCAYQFEQQLRMMLERRYVFLGLVEFLDRLQHGRSVAGCLAVTFDDAYVGVGEVMPLLSELGIPATIFVPTGFIGGRGFWWDRLDRVLQDPRCPTTRLATYVGGSAEDRPALFRRLRDAQLGRGGWMDAEFEEVIEDMERATGLLPCESLRPMTWTELRAWSRWEGGTCAVHTVRHPVLPRLSVEDQVAEIRECHDRLAACVPVLPILAYPYGLYDASAITAARQAHMRAAVTMDGYGVRYGDGEIWAIPRIPYGSRAQPGRLGLHLTGALRSYRQRQSFEGGYPRIPLRHQP